LEVLEPAHAHRSQGTHDELPSVAHSFGRGLWRVELRGECVVDQDGARSSEAGQPAGQVDHGAEDVAVLV
jgi:hypothetical protein